MPRSLKIDNAERRTRLGTRQYLAQTATSPIVVANDLVGLHSSDPATVYLAARARIDSFSVEDLKEAMYDDRTLLRVLGMRRTMFVVPPELAGVMDAACTQAMVNRETNRLKDMIEAQDVTSNGLTWIARVEDEVLAALAVRGPSTARQLTEGVPDLGVKLTYALEKSYGGTIGVSTRVLFLLATRGAIVRGRPLGSWLSSQYRWALTEDWLGRPLIIPDVAHARVELASRWLASYGPGTLTDLKWWTGWNLRDTRAALAKTGAVAVELEDGEPAFVLPGDLDAHQKMSDWASFLPSLDPTPMGWKERAWYLGENFAALYDRNGNVGPTVWANGRVVGGWSQGSEGQLRYRLLEPVTATETEIIEDEAHRLEEWLGDTIVKPRFGTPLDKELRGT